MRRLELTMPVGCCVWNITSRNTPSLNNFGVAFCFNFFIFASCLLYIALLHNMAASSNVLLPSVLVLNFTV